MEASLISHSSTTILLGISGYHVDIWGLHLKANLEKALTCLKAGKIKSDTILTVSVDMRNYSPVFWKFNSFNLFTIAVLFSANKANTTNT